nr:4Fe-4S dicluster domain-containing protein [Sedimentibacter sp.]
MNKKFDNHAQYIKYKVLKEVIKSEKLGVLTNDLLSIPERIIPGPEANTRCCIYKERAIIGDRIKNVLSASNDKIVSIINLACDECPVYRFSVTEACRGCLAHHCQENCPVGAIDIIDKRAHINQEKCIECGKCRNVCPFEAISDVKRPCKTSCKVGALNIDPETKKAIIDEDSCINCGACVSRCPFGAITDNSHALDIMKIIRESEHNTKYKVYCIVAPSIAAQFPDAEIDNIVSAIKKLGFYEVVEAAIGADMVANYEARLLEQELKHKSFITSSCCPSFVSYIKLKYPELVDNISSSVSPMIATARLIRETDKNAKIIFIGPCVAKKAEIGYDNLKDDIQYSMSFEELLAFLDAYEIDPVECQGSPLDNASYFGRIFAHSGGVTKAIKNSIEEQNLNIDLKPVVCDGLEECDKALRLAKLGKLNGNFIEGMACKGGCVNGPVSLYKKQSGTNIIDTHANKAREKSIKDSLKVFNLDDINLEL